MLFRMRRTWVAYCTDLLEEARHNKRMALGSRILSVDRHHDGVIITFADGKVAHYSATFLEDNLPKAEEVTMPPDPNDEED
jgi:hypothetical protein